jgi:trehalose 6-phosphate synthase
MVTQARDRLVVLSNRLPVEAVVDETGSLRLEPGAGGLVTAMAPVLRARGGIWLGWAGVDDSRHQEAEELLSSAGSDAGIELLPVPITHREVEEYYYGFANQVIWPLFHDLVCRCHFEPSFWSAYQSANARFAEAVAAAARPGDQVWIHDYHLLCAGSIARDLGLDNPLAFFLHIPFPTLDLFLKLPWRNQILRGLLAYDLIGLQTERDRQNLVHCIEALAPEVRLRAAGRLTRGQLEDGHEVRIGCFPIGIDFGEFARHPGRRAGPGESPPEPPLRPAHHVLLGVDRLDYSKGIPQRLRALAYALERHPELRGHIALIQVVVPSRTHLADYRALKSEIDQLVGQINGRFARTDWLPIHYCYRSLRRPDLLAYYQQADVAVVTPLKDGMNLVAKEYCAARLDDTGVLILSELAGAFAQLRDGALVVNPHDLVGMADAMYRACTMPVEERRARMRSLRRCVRERDVHRWADEFLHAAFGREEEPRQRVKSYAARAEVVAPP